MTPFDVLDIVMTKPLYLQRTVAHNHLRGVIDTFDQTHRLRMNPFDVLDIVMTRALYFQRTVVHNHLRYLRELLPK